LRTVCPLRPRLALAPAFCTRRYGPSSPVSCRWPVTDEAIGLFQDFRDTHSHEEMEARALAVSAITEDCAVDVDAIDREMAA
jgi:hypothetical protein